MDMESPTTSKGLSFNDIMAMAAVRQNDSSPLMAQMREVRDRYNGDIVYPWSEAIAGGADMPDLTPHMVGESIDNYGLRAASVPLDIICPPLYPGKESGYGSRDWANIRRGAVAATLYDNRWPLLVRRFMRHIAGYSVAALVVEPDFKACMPRIKVLNPLSAFPDPRSAEEYHDPTDCVFINGFSASHLRAQFPELRQEAGGPIPPHEQGNQLWDVIKYIDEDVMVIGLAGKRQTWDKDILTYGRWTSARELSRIENRTGMYPGVAMSRVTLDRVGSALAHIMGQLDWAARLQLLDVVATEKSIFPDTYILGDGARQPKLHTSDGRWKDGRTGEVNMIENAAAIGQLRNTPDPSGKQSIDRLERNSRVSMGLAAQFGGETTNALRTGRGIETMMGASVDPRLEEMQQTVLAWMPHLGKVIQSMWEQYWPDMEVARYSGYPGAKGHVKFTPGKHFSDSKQIAFTYPIAGGDIQLTNIVLSQQLGAGAITLHTFRQKHPWIDDPDGEAKRIGEEKLEELAFQAMTQQAMGGEIPLEQLALIEEEYKKETNNDIFTAIRNAVQKLKETQAEEVPEAPEELAAPPEIQPGLGGPSGPAQAPAELPPAIAPTSGMEGLRELQNALAAGGRRVSGVTGPQ